MPNSFFNFKEFSIQQEDCAMKVCTDACLFGAWVADKFSKKTALKNILDIGSGTGLLCLMLAQKIPVQILGVEVEETCAAQSRRNIEASKFKAQIEIVTQKIQEFDAGQVYDLVCSNPPFYQNDLASPTASKNLAMHSTDLSLNELALSLDKFVEPSGAAAILLPHHRSAAFENLMKGSGFFLLEKVEVHHNPVKAAFRSMHLHSRLKSYEVKQGRINIREDNGEYSREFKKLLGDYYLSV